MRSSQEILKLTPCLQGWGFEIFLCYSYKVKYSWISVIISVWKISLAAKLWGLLRPLKTCQIMCIVKARWIPEIQTCQSLPISLLCSFPPKIRDWEFCDEGLDNCGAGNKKETGAFIDLTLQVIRARELQRKRARRTERNQRKSPFVTRTWHVLRFIIWVEVQMWCWTMRYGATSCTMYIPIGLIW